MKIYCGDYMNYKPPRRYRWARLGILAACLLFTSAATPAMFSYYWNGQNSTKSLDYEAAMRIAHDDRMPVPERRSAQAIAYVAAKKAVAAIKAAGDVPELNEGSVILLDKLVQQIGGRK